MQAENRQPRTEGLRPYEGGGNYTTLGSDYDEIDTTPTLDPRPSHEAPRRMDTVSPNDMMPDEIDTTPQPIERPSETASSQPAEPAPAPKPEAEAEENRPKRNGWWQRKSFF
jgi:hypothetical protein